MTHAGCGALCPSYARGCYGCFGPQESPNTSALSQRFQEYLGVTQPDLVRAYRNFNGYAGAFRKEAAKHANSVE